MSGPIASFEKLSISQMQRAHQKGKGKAIATADDTSEEESEEELDEEQDSDEGEGTDLEASYKPVYAIDHCRRIRHRDSRQASEEPPISTHYAFQMAYADVQRYSVRINNIDESPTCTCKETGVCKHSEWLQQQLQHLPCFHSPNSEGFGRQDATPYEQISTQGIQHVCEELQWELRDGPDSDTEETRWTLKKDHSSRKASHHQTRSTIRNRMKEVRDIMATLSPVVTDDFRGDIFENIDDFGNEAFTQNDIEATVSKLLILDDDIFRQFRSLVSRDVRAQDYFAKMAKKARHACDRLDKFCEVGMAAGNCDLIWCAQTLIDIVSSISLNLVERQPLMPASKEAAAKALVSILGMVIIERNYDVIYVPDLPRRRPHGEPSIDRNLYLRLIGDPRKSSAGPNFIIKTLQDLPEALPFLDSTNGLEHILKKLEEVAWKAPNSKAYHDKLAAIVKQLKGSANASPTGTGSSKRPAGALERSSKRMK